MKLGPYFLYTSVAVLTVLLTAAPASAFDGRVVTVNDGDTVAVIDAQNIKHRVRIAGIDAPEKNQPFGPAATESLARLTLGQRVEARCHKRDRYGREVCEVFAAGRDVGLEQLQSGLAWWYREYAREQPPDERASYEAAETAARSAHRGLWRDEHPTPPWAWRKQMRSGRSPAA
jgi:endonuclease YncB( thermonuclease family)